MATTNNLKIIYGTGGFIRATDWPEERVGEFFDFLEKEGIDTIDSAEGYGESEKILGRDKAASRGFKIDTKMAAGLNPAVAATKENVIKAGEESLRKLATDQVEVYYIHAPDRKVPFKDTLEGVNELYKAGKFKRFGLSNFLPEEVEDVIRIAKENDFVLPSVYEGNYNAVGRLVETQLFPVLRKHNISFFAYSPIAGGFLTKTPQDITDGKGRFNLSIPFFGQLYNSLYNKPGMLDFLAKFGKIASEEGIPQAELAYRWVTYHSYLEAEKGDAIIIGAHSISELDGTLSGLKKGPLSQEVAKKVDELWKGVEGEAIFDNFNDYIYKHQQIAVY